ncbi:right-handed parallel beta-helix repeat-containing protein [Haladaptatus sp. CMAA 1911]|uniref:right-handed parallel beta-helix repeat-containing protein n=1 Tax=unclassified Haladaptatus TaxID=2622732 RepID=UPI003754C6B4
MVPTQLLPSRARWIVLLVGLSIILAALSLVIQPSLFNDTPLAEEPVPISHCTVISEEGTYTLTQDIRGGRIASSCIRIKESHVTLQGSKHTLMGRGATDSTAILISSPDGVSDVTVRSIKTTRWNRGVHLVNTSDATLQDVDAWRNTEGVTVWNSTKIRIKDCRLTNNLFGLVVDRSSPRVSVSSVYFEGNNIWNISWGEYQSQSGQPQIQHQDRIK